MSFHLTRETPGKGVMVPRARNPVVLATVPQWLCDRMRADAERRGIPLAAIIREKLILGYRTPTASPATSAKPPS